MESPSCHPQSGSLGARAGPSALSMIRGRHVCASVLLDSCPWGLGGLAPGLPTSQRPAGRLAPGTAESMVSA